MVWKKDYILLSFCSLHCCDLNFFDISPFLIKSVMSSIGVSMVLLACLVSFVGFFVKMKQSTISTRGLIWYRTEGHVGSYDMIHICN